MSAELNREGWSETEHSKKSRHDGDEWRQWSASSTSGERKLDHGRTHTHLVVSGTEREGWSGSMGFSIDCDVPTCIPRADTPEGAAAALEQLRDTVIDSIHRAVADARRAALAKGDAK